MCKIGESNDVIVNVEIYISLWWSYLFLFTSQNPRNCNRCTQQLFITKSTASWKKYWRSFWIRSGSLFSSWFYSQGNHFSFLNYTKLQEYRKSCMIKFIHRQTFILFKLLRRKVKLTNYAETCSISMMEKNQVTQNWMIRKYVFEKPNPYRNSFCGILHTNIPALYRFCMVQRSQVSCIKMIWLIFHWT